ncbi:MAG: MotA/TolQ/ExbB proton channel family protein [Prevotella sp.]|nr:MotA/TolQ/ExbB proton channel family protein [Prevotella sp.]
MRRIIVALVVILSAVLPGIAQQPADSMKSGADTVAAAVTVADSVADASLEELIGDEDMAELEAMATQMSLHQKLRSKFVEGSPGFMSLVALALVLGLAFCVERIIYLTLSEVNARRLLADIEKRVESGNREGAKSLCRNTRGPVASICYQGLLHADESVESIERNIMNYGNLQIMRMERGCSWIRLFIAIAPSLGFLGTVIGMVMAFDQIQEAGDMSAAIVAEGMKVALITTIFGIIVAIVLQVFYNFILSKIDHLTAQMEDSAITLVDILSKQKQ